MTAALPSRTTARSHRGVKGFTLLEVIVAMTITAMVLGGLFSLAAGSKRLAFTARENLQEAVQTRAHIQYALLDNGYAELEPILAGDEYRMSSGDLLPDPLRRTAPTPYLLTRYQLIHRETNETIDGVRWTRFELPR